MRLKRRRLPEEQDEDEADTLEQGQPLDVQDQPHVVPPGGRPRRQRTAHTWAALPQGVSLLGPTAALDNEERAFDLGHIVVDFTAVGLFFGKQVLLRDEFPDPSSVFDYEGVRRCVRYLSEERQLAITGIMCEVYEVPADIRAMCESVELAPQVHAAMAWCAYERNCRFLSNMNYRDVCRSLQDANCRRWMLCCHEVLQVGFFFDTELGTFETLEGNCPVRLLLPEAQWKCEGEAEDPPADERGSRGGA